MTETKKKTTKVTSVAEYRRSRSEGKLIELPSGNVFKIKVLTVMDYIKLGLTDIPNDFFRFITDVQNGVIRETEEDKESAKKNTEFFQLFLSKTIENGVIDPPMCLYYEEEKANTHLIYSELSLEDQKALMDAIVGIQG